MSETKKSKGGRPPVNATPVTVRIPPDLLKALDQSRSAQDGVPSRPEAIRLALAEWLRTRGYLAKEGER